MSRFVEILQGTSARSGRVVPRRCCCEMIERLDADVRPHRDVVPLLRREESAGVGRQEPDGLRRRRFIGEIHDGTAELHDAGRGAGDQPVPLLEEDLGVRRAQPALAHHDHGARARAPWIEELIDIAEQEASCEVFGMLKRPDEKYVTERAYDNPKFVEDLVRDVAVGLNSKSASRLRGRSGELRVDPQPLRLRADREEQTGALARLILGFLLW